MEGSARSTVDATRACSTKPTLLVDVTNDTRVAQEKIFRPVAVVTKFHSKEEVITIANDSIYRLGAAFGPGTSTGRFVSPAL